MSGAAEHVCVCVLASVPAQQKLVAKTFSAFLGDLLSQDEHTQDADVKL